MREPWTYLVGVMMAVKEAQAPRRSLPRRLLLAAVRITLLVSATLVALCVVVRQPTPAGNTRSAEYVDPEAAISTIAAVHNPTRSRCCG